MAKSEKAKALEAKQKEAVRAEKLRRKNSTNPADWSQYRQVREVLRTTSEHDPQLKGLLAAVGVGSALLVLLLGWALGTAGWVWIFWVLLAVMVAVALMMLVLMQRAKKATITRYEGQAGSAEVALSMLPAKKYTRSPAVAFTRQMDMVHRVVGPAGVVLVAEGQPSRVRPLLTQEKKRHEQVLFGVPVHTMVLGDAPGQVKLGDLAKAIEKLPKSVQPIQQTQVDAKLRSLDAVRPKAPIPKGPQPAARGMNRAMRGR